MAKSFIKCKVAIFRENACFSKQIIMLSEQLQESIEIINQGQYFNKEDYFELNLVRRATTKIVPEDNGRYR